MKDNPTVSHKNGVLLMFLIDIFRKWTLPFAIVAGTVFYLLFAHVPFLSETGDFLGRLFDTIFPFCVFLTLFTTFSKVDFHKMRLKRWHLCLIFTQLLLIGSISSIALLFSHNYEVKILIEAMLTCIIAPCATAAPVVTGKLGGDINTMTTYTLISSVICAITIPLVFPLLEHVENVTFIKTFLIILNRLSIVILLPLVLGWFVRHYLRSAYHFILIHPNLSFYLWAFTLSITTGVTVRNISHSNTSIYVLLLICLLSFLICIVHFKLGRKIGHRYHEPINCGQGMFQKNTAMAIWVSYMYLHPVASIGAGCYVLWQNIINSWEIASYQEKQNKKVKRAKKN